MSPIVFKNDIMKSVSDMIHSSSLIDSEIADLIGVSRQMVFKLRTCKVSSIRKTNLVSLANALNYKVEFDKDSIKLDKIELHIEKEVNDMALLAEEMIKDLRDDKHYLRERIESLKNENKALHTTIDSMNRNLEALNNQLNQTQITMPVLELDKHQNVVNVKEGIYMNVSPLFAEKLGYTVFELVGRSYYDVLAEEDRQMWMEFAATKNKEAFTEKPKGCKQEITKYEVRFEDKSGNILNAKCNTKKLSNLISMNEITFLD